MPLPGDRSTAGKLETLGAKSQAREGELTAHNGTISVSALLTSTATYRVHAHVEGTPVSLILDTGGRSYRSAARRMGENGYRESRTGNTDTLDRSKTRGSGWHGVAGLGM